MIMSLFSRVSQKLLEQHTQNLAWEMLGHLNDPTFTKQFEQLVEALPESEGKALRDLYDQLHAGLKRYEVGDAP